MLTKQFSFFEGVTAFCRLGAAELSHAHWLSASSLPSSLISHSSRVINFPFMLLFHPCLFAPFLSVWPTVWALFISPEFLSSLSSSSSSTELFPLSDLTVLIKQYAQCHQYCGKACYTALNLSCTWWGNKTIDKMLYTGNINNYLFNARLLRKIYGINMQKFHCIA